MVSAQLAQFIPFTLQLIVSMAKYADAANLPQTHLQGGNINATGLLFHQCRRGFRAREALFAIIATEVHRTQAHKCAGIAKFNPC
jgi:hypothetical protein